MQSRVTRFETPNTKIKNPLFMAFYMFFSTTSIFHRLLSQCLSQCLSHMSTFYEEAMQLTDAAEKCFGRFYKKVGKKNDDDEVSVDMIEQKGGTKKDLALLVLKFLNLSVNCMKVVKSGCATVDCLTKEAKDALKDLTVVQHELVDSKKREISALQTGVQKTVRTELKSYSDAVKNASSSSLSVKKIRSVVREAVEDKSCNLMIFGLPEKENEKDQELSESVKDIIDELEMDEKPAFTACRIGRVTCNKPVKVTFSNPRPVHMMLRHAKSLKDSESYCKVFLSPDRTEEQRQKHQELVTSLKEKAKEDPSKHFFIRRGQICCVDKVVKKKETSDSGTSDDGETESDTSKDEVPLKRISAGGKVLGLPRLSVTIKKPNKH